MESDISTRVCPVEASRGLDNSIRRLLQNPKKILKPHIEKGMTVLDFGCGPGFFSVEIAKMLDGNGKVIAADLQQGMLEIVKSKINHTQLKSMFELHLCQQNKIGLNQKVDFIFAFYVVHEVPNKESLFREIKSILKPNGKMYIVEPSFHVTKESFNKMINTIKQANFSIIEFGKIFLSRTVLISNT